jgi:glycosyltransferase involved in cell wall biosynthesis
VIAGETILCFAPDPWDDIWRNRHQIMSRLARKNLVVYIEPRPDFRMVVRAVVGGAIRPVQLRARLRHVIDGLYVYTPPGWAPVSGREPLQSLLRRAREMHLKRVLRRLNAGRPILWLVRPDQDDVPGHWNEKLCVYQIVDEYSGYPGLTPERRQKVQDRERRLIARADVVLVTSPPLLEAKRQYNSRTYLVPNGVDFDAFSRAWTQPVEPDDVKDVPRPRIGYVGAVNNKVDFALLRELVRLRPDWSLVLVGPGPLLENAEAVALCRDPGVYWLGKRDVSLVPHYMLSLDVCLMPYKLNEWTRHIDPLKLYEYMAAGRPVVSTPIPAVEPFAEWVSVADGTEAFAAAVEEALQQDDLASQERRRGVAARHTWDARVELISQNVAEALQPN